MKTKIGATILAALIGVAFTADLHAQVGTFTNINAGLTPLGLSTVAWGDYDGDGRLDLLLAGDGPTNKSSEIWHQNSDGTFSNVTATAAATLPGVNGEAVSGKPVAIWVNANNDQRLDFLIAGTQQNPPNPNFPWYAELWLGMSDGTFFPTGGPLDMPTVAPAVAWGDADEDGHLDFLIMGYRGQYLDNNLRFSSQFFRNSGTTFVRSFIPGLPNATYPQPAVVWGDYDNDGRLDFLWSGGGYADGTFLGNLSQIWHNEGNGTFSNVTAIAAPGLPGVYGGASVAWGDYDNDGRLDFILSGVTNSSNIRIWHNNGDGTFSDQSAALAPTMPGLTYGTLDWGDYDNDGRLDILVSGQNSLGWHVQVWRNTGNGFTNIIASLSKGQTARWGDYDNDGRLDIVLTGGSPQKTEIWRNTLTAENNPPSTPTGLQASVTGSVVTLNWSASTDDHTPSASLSYNVRIGTSPGAWDVMSPMSLPSGKLTVPGMGNVQLNTSRPFRAQFGATYYWSVQAVDGAYAGSPFASEQSFTLTATANKPGDIDGNGVVDQSEFTTVVSNYWLTSPPDMETVLSPSNTVFQFGLMNLDTLNFQVRAATNPSLPLVDWTNIGVAELTYQFSDPEATNYPARFYRLVWP